MPDFSSVLGGTGSFQTFNPTTLVQAITGIIFYLALLVISIMSLFTIYSLIKYADSKATAFIVTVIYLVIFFALASAGMHALTLI